MPNRTTHVSDEDLLRAMDGELDRLRRAGVDAHLSSCGACQARREELDAVITSLAEAHRDDLDARIPPAEGPRAMLKARLRSLEPTRAAAARARVRNVWAALTPPARRAGSVLAGLVVVLFIVVTPPRPWIGSSGELKASVTPDARLTPGATAVRSRESVCVDRREAEPTPVSRAVALTIFRTYGIASPPPGAYELDFLIAPELGGATDASNLWPQPYAGLWNAHLKDALEDHLYGLVCSGRLDLNTAQHEIATDWVTAYRKYFQTQSPLPQHQQFRKDDPWR